MARARIFSKLKTLWIGSAICALFSFAIQSQALPIHASIHAAQRGIQSSPSIPVVVESDCELCDLALHQAVNVSGLESIDPVEMIAIRAEVLHAVSLPTTPLLFPPVRGPPSRV
jgi:hypothetical protein